MAAAEGSRGRNFYRKFEASFAGSLFWTKAARNELPNMPLLTELEIWLGLGSTKMPRLRRLVLLSGTIVAYQSPLPVGFPKGSNSLRESFRPDAERYISPGRGGIFVETEAPPFKAPFRCDIALADGQLGAFGSPCRGILLWRFTSRVNAGASFQLSQISFSSRVFSLSFRARIRRIVGQLNR
jgi:hypothetical protein